MDHFLLDTNVVSEVSKPAPDVQVLAWVQAVAVHRLSVITIGELSKGLSLLPPGRRRAELERSVNLYLRRRDVLSLPITEQVAVAWGRLTALRQRAGRPLPFADGLIAATALQHDLVLATRNTRDFADLGVRLIDPWQTPSVGIGRQ